MDDQLIWAVNDLLSSDGPAYGLQMEGEKVDTVRPGQEVKGARAAEIQL